MSDQLSCQIADVTPRYAEELLDSNLRNRPLRGHYVLQLAEAMERGEWTVNGEPIQVGSDGTLLNGQHRLQAVVESGVTVKMLLVRNVNPNARRTIDSGARRNLSDVLKLHEHVNTTHLAAGLALLHRYRTGARMETSARNAPTPTQALELLDREPAIEQGVHLAQRVYREAHLRISITVVLCHLFNEADPGAGTRFFEALCVVDTTRRGDPLRELRIILARIHEEPTYVLRTYTLCALTIKAFNAWSADEKIRDLRFRSGEKFPSIHVKAAAAA